MTAASGQQRQHRAAVVDKLVEKGRFQADVAQAIAESVDITIKAANLVTLPNLEARFAASEAKMEARFAASELNMEQRFAAAEQKMEARFGAIEKSIESTRASLTYQYAGLAVVFFSALAMDHHWLVNREDQLITQIQTATEQRLDQFQARTDQRFEQMQARTDQRFEQMEARTDQRFEQVRHQQDEILEQLRTLTAKVNSIQRATKQR